MHKMQQTSEAVRATTAAGEAQAAPSAYADDGGIFGHGALAWRRQWKGTFSVKDNQYVDAGRSWEQCRQLIREQDLDPDEYLITCADWSDDWTDEQKAQARRGGAAPTA